METRMKMGSVPIIIFLCIFFAIGFGITGRALFLIWKAKKAEAWPATRATLHSCALEEIQGGEGIEYRVTVDYSYRVGGKPYRGERLAFGYEKSGDRKKHEKIIEKLNKALVVAVRANPANPSEAVLAYGTDRAAFTMLVGGITWLLFVTGFTALVVMDGWKGRSLAERIEIVERKSPADRDGGPGLRPRRFHRIKAVRA